MAARTTTAAVATVLGDNLGPLADGETLPDLQQFIDTASPIVDRVVTEAANRGVTLTAAEQERIECWLAAHYYAAMDPLYQSKSTQGASGNFQGQAGMSLESTRYGQVAINLDWSGALASMGKRQFARCAWLGKPVSAQIPIDQRS